MLFPQLQQQLAEILPGFRSGISQQHEGGCLPKIAFKCILLKAALIYSSLKWMCLPEQKQLSLSTSFSVTFSPPPPCFPSLALRFTQSHTSYLFSLQSLRGLQPLIVSQTGTTEKSVDGSAGCMHERGKARLGTALSRGGSRSLISLPTSIPQNDHLKLKAGFPAVPEDVSH